MSRRRPKVIVAKIGLDGHDRGSRIIATSLRDAGMEVIYTPPWQEISSIVKLVLEEDPDVLGISSLATDHRIVPKLMSSLRDAGVEDVRVVVGGIIPQQDEPELLESGVAQIFRQGTPIENIIDSITSLAQQRRDTRKAAI